MGGSALDWLMIVGKALLLNFVYTQAYAIEDGIGLTKKHTNFRQKGGPVRNQDLCFDRGSYQANRVAYQPVKENRKRPSGSAQTACEYAVRIRYLARGVYKVQEMGFNHNHEPFEGASAQPSGRRLTVGDQKNIGRLSITGIKARQIKQFFEQQSAPNRPEPTKRVIYNV